MLVYSEKLKISSVTKYNTSCCGILPNPCGHSFMANYVIQVLGWVVCNIWDHSWKIFMQNNFLPMFSLLLFCRNKIQKEMYQCDQNILKIFYVKTNIISDNFLKQVISILRGKILQQCLSFV